MKKPKPIPISERDVKNQIKDYLKALGIFYYHNLQGIGCFKGLSDICGIYKGRPFAIEAKAFPNGKLSENQKTFLENFKRAGGIAIVAYGIDDVIEGFKEGGDAL